MVLSYGQPRERRPDLFLRGGSDHQPRSFPSHSCQRDRCGGIELGVCPYIRTRRLLCKSFYGYLYMETDDRPVGRHLSCGDPRDGKRNRRIELYPQFPDNRKLRYRSESFNVVDSRGRTIISASSTLHEWPAWTRLFRVGFGRSGELGEPYYGNTDDLSFRLDRCECLAVSEAFLSDSTRTVGRAPSPLVASLKTSNGS